MDNENCDSHNMIQDSFNNNDIQHHVVTEENQPIIENNRNRESLAKFKRKKLVNDQDLW